LWWSWRDFNHWRGKPHLATPNTNQDAERDGGSRPAISSRLAIIDKPRFFAKFLNTPRAPMPRSM
jgi:hypothetical protein